MMRLMTSSYQARILHIIIKSYPWWHLPDSINNQTQIGALTSPHFFHCCQQAMHIISSGLCPGETKQCLCVYRLLDAIIIMGKRLSNEHKAMKYICKIRHLVQNGIGKYMSVNKPRSKQYGKSGIKS